MGALAQYNLGLIDDKLGNTSQAQQHYRVAYDRAIRETGSWRHQDRSAIRDAERR
jgi:hypothetical protein